jgi:hypothetical protein
MTQEQTPQEALWAAFLALIGKDTDLAKLFNTLQPAAGALKKIIEDYGLGAGVDTVSGLGAGDPGPSMNRLRTNMSEEQWMEFCRRLIANSTAAQIRRLNMENDSWDLFWTLGLAALVFFA